MPTMSSTIMWGGAWTSRFVSTVATAAQIATVPTARATSVRMATPHRSATGRVRPGGMVSPGDGPPDPGGRARTGPARSPGRRPASRSGAVLHLGDRGARRQERGHRRRGELGAPQVDHGEGAMLVEEQLPPGHPELDVGARRRGGWRVDPIVQTGDGHDLVGS